MSETKGVSPNMPGDGNRVMPPRALSRFQFHPSREPTGPRTRTPPSRCAAAALPRALAGPSQRKLGVLGRHATLPPFLASWRESTAEAPASRRSRRCVAPACGVKSLRDLIDGAPPPPRARPRFAFCAAGWNYGRTGPDQDPRTRALTTHPIKDQSDFRTIVRYSGVRRARFRLPAS